MNDQPTKTGRRRILGHEPPAPIRTDRETARATLADKIERERRLLADPAGFSTIDPNYIIRHAEWGLRWLDCAPEGANHLVAPLQDKAGVPMGLARNENVGACRALREARAARGVHPLSGEPLAFQLRLTALRSQTRRSEHDRSAH